MRPRMTIVAVFILIAGAGWWISKGPQKGVSKKIQWSIDEETKRVVPIFQLHYEWDGVEEDDPTWMVFPREGKWWVVDLRHVIRAFSDVKSEGELHDKTRKYRQEFSYRWIENRKFEPKASRGEVVMTALGFDVLFSKERHAFFDFLDSGKAFDEGRLHPDN